MMWGGVARMLAFLEPAAVPCLICGQACKWAGSHVHLCERCLRQIPWITHLLCRRCGRPIACPDCGKAPFTWLVNNRSAVSYSEEMKRWLALFKYRGNERLLSLFGEMMLPVLHAMLDEMRSSYTVLTFVPLSKERLEERGFNQAEQLAKYLGDQADLPVFQLLQRVRHTRKQSFQTKRERIHAMDDAFVIHREGLARLRALQGRKVNVVIIDDVYTTGSTLKHCANVICSAAQWPIYSLTWARA